MPNLIFSRKAFEKLLFDSINMIEDVKIFRNNSIESFFSSDYCIYGIYNITLKKGEKNQQDEVIKNNKSKIYINGANNLIFYISDYNNPFILKELDFIQSNYFFSMGTKQTLLKLPTFFVLIIKRLEITPEGLKYCYPNKNIIAYDGYLNGKYNLNLFMFRTVTQNELANTIENFIFSNRGCNFKYIYPIQFINSHLINVVIKIDKNLNINGNVKREVLTIEKKNIILFTYDNDIQIYISDIKLSQKILDLGNAFLNNRGKRLEINCFDKLIVMIFQK